VLDCVAAELMMMLIGVGLASGNMLLSINVVTLRLAWLRGQVNHLRRTRRADQLSQAILLWAG